MLNAKMGVVFVLADGSVYFAPYEDAIIEGEKVDIRAHSKKLFGDTKEYRIESNKFIIGDRFFDYKLDLSSVRFVLEFYFGNGGSNSTLLFIHNNGNVSELSYSNGNFKLYKDIPGYANIVSAVIDGSESGWGARLYDICGNGMYYHSPNI